MAWKKFVESLKKDKLNKWYSFFLLALSFISFIFLIFFFSLKVIEAEIIIWLFIFISIGVYWLFVIGLICKKSENNFLNKNPLLFQIVVIILLSIALGSFFIQIFYPINLPYTIHLGPLDYHPFNDSNQTESSPSVKLVCKQDSFKNMINKRNLDCEIEKTTGWNGTEIEIIEIDDENGIRYWHPKKGDKIVSIRLENEREYKIKAYYEGGDISLTLFRKINFLSEEEYGELRNKRMGLIGAFVIFSLTALTSFLRNIKEIMKKEKSKNM